MDTKILDNTTKDYVSFQEECEKRRLEEDRIRRLNNPDPRNVPFKAAKTKSFVQRKPDSRNRSDHEMNYNSYRQM